MKNVVIYGWYGTQYSAVIGYYLLFQKENCLKVERGAAFLVLHATNGIKLPITGSMLLLLNTVLGRTRQAVSTLYRVRSLALQPLSAGNSTEFSQADNSKTIQHRATNLTYWIP